MTTNPNINELKDWKTKRDMAAYYKCHLRTITNLMRRGILPYRKIGRFVRLDPVECDRAMDKFKHRGLLDNEANPPERVCV
jgi:hypothetical protein